MLAHHFDNRADWLKARSGPVLGGSSIAAIVGRHPHKTAWSVWMDCMGVSTPHEDTPRLRMGRRMESIVLDEWEQEHGPLTLERRPYDLHYHAEFPWAVATLDALILDDGDYVGIAEAKTVCGHQARYGWGAPGEVRILRARDLDAGVDVLPVPSHYLLQCVWESIIAGLDEVRLIALFGSDMDGVREWIIPRPEWLSDMLLSAAVAWYGRHVENGEPPPLDGSDECRDFYRAPLVGRKLVRVECPPPEAETLRRKYERAAAAGKAAEAEKDEARNALLALGYEAQNVRGQIVLKQPDQMESEAA